MAPTVTGRRASPGKLELEGMAVITVYYISTGDGIAHGEYKVPFYRIVEMKADHPAPVLSLSPRVDYVNCRAVNQRRLDIRGALVIGVRATGSREEQVTAEGEGMGLQLKREQADASRLLGQCARESHVTERVDLPHGKPPVQAIVRVGAAAQAVEVKQVAGKAVIRGELTLHILYQSAPGEFGQLDYTLPTNTICELDGLTEESVCDVWQQVTSVTAEPAATEDGEYRCLSIDALVESQVRGWQPYTARYCSDCYSTSNLCTFRTRTASISRVCRAVRETVSCKETIPLPEKAESVVDLWCEVIGAEPRSESGGPVAALRLAVSMFARMEDGQIYYFDKVLELSHKLPCDAEGAALEARASCQGCGWSVSGGTDLEIRCDIQLCGVLLCQGRAALLEDIRLVCQKKSVWLFVDECFLDLAEGGQSLRGRLGPGEKLFLLRAFTKTFSMAALRLGYGLCGDSGLLSEMARRSQPWNVSLPAQLAGVAALEDQDYLVRSRALIRAERRYLAAALAALGLRVCPSDANYLLFRGPADLKGQLLARGILIRDCSNYRGLGPGWYRTAVKLPEENRRLAEALRHIL